MTLLNIDVVTINEDVILLLIFMLFNLYFVLIVINVLNWMKRVKVNNFEEFA